MPPASVLSLCVLLFATHGHSAPLPPPVLAGVEPVSAANHRATLLDRAKAIMTNAVVAAMSNSARVEFLKDKGLTVDEISSLSPRDTAHTHANVELPDAEQQWKPPDPRGSFHAPAPLHSPVSAHHISISSTRVPATHTGTTLAISTTTSLQTTRGQPPTTGTPTYDIERLIYSMDSFAAFVGMTEAYRFFPLFYAKIVHPSGAAANVSDIRLFCSLLCMAALLAAHKNFQYGFTSHSFNPRLIELQ